MSVSSPGQGRGTDAPTLTLDVLELAEMLRGALTDPARRGRAYTQAFSYKKTDIAQNVGVAVAASRQVLGGDVNALCGWAVKETTNAATASFVLHDGNSANGEVLVPINLAINESTRDIVMPHGIEVATGRVFLELISGSVSGVIYWR